MIRKSMFTAFVAVLLWLVPLLSGAQDTDSDGMPDAWEIAHSCLQPSVADDQVDYDADGLTSLREYQYSSLLDPCAADTDADVVDDGDEVENGANPLDPGIIPSLAKLGLDLRVTSAANISYYPSLVWKGDEYGLAWSDQRDGNLELYFTRLSAAGSEIGDDLRITTNSGTSYYPSLIYTGTEYGVIWQDSRDGNYELYFTRFSETGTKIGSDLRVTTALQNSEYPSLVWTGSEFAVAWDDFRDGNNEIYSARLAPDGTKIGGGDLRITNNTSGSYRPSLVWTGSEFGVCWYDSLPGNNEIYFTRAAADGTLLGPELRFTYDAANSYAPTLAWTGSEFGVSWYDNRDGNYEIYFSRISPSGDPIGNDLRLTFDAAIGDYSSLVWASGAFGVAWQDNRDGNYEIYFAWLTKEGNQLGHELRITADPSAAASYIASLKWTGAEFGVAWYDQRDADYEIYFARIGVDPDGDGLRGPEEAAAGTNPLDWDTDNDLLSDGYEITMSSTNPLAADSDGDQLSDYVEAMVKPCLNPWAADTDGDGLSDGAEDADHDGILDAGETDPCLYDTDGDGLNDGLEVNTYNTNPLLPDTDGDLVGDYVEAVVKPCLNELAIDTDGDGLADGLEDADHDGALDPAETDPCLADTDGDGLSDSAELNTYLTNPRLPDTDGDGLSDGFEVNVSHTNPLLADTDGDGLSDGQEVNTYNTNPLLADTDGDQVSDYVEAVVRPCMNALAADTDGDGIGDGVEDADHDGALDPGETDPCLADTDGDGLSDSAELNTYLTNPRLADTDGDGLADGLEVNTSHTNPLLADTDGDGLTDGQEVNIYQTNPLQTDTDGDQESDYLEAVVKPCLNELAIDTDGDGIGDGVEDADHDGELDPGETDPCLADTDGDGLSDYAEVYVYSTNPWVTDTDGDGENDYLEAVTRPCLNEVAADTDGDGLADGLEDADHDGVKDANETDPCAADTDGDGLADGVEDANHDGILDPGETDPRLADTDGEGLSDFAELYVYFTNPRAADTDGDGENDYLEAVTKPCLNELAADTDGDGLADGVEDADHDGSLDANETDPCLADTDGDLMPDGWEVQNNTCVNPVAPDAAGDLDGDGLNNLAEYQCGSDPCIYDALPDADADGLPNCQELSLGTNPNDPDTDDDGLSDGDEYNVVHTNPKSADTDGDLMPDGWEVQNNTCVNPLAADATGDLDGDGLNNLAEYQGGTDPCIYNAPVDSDGDGLTDTLELSLGTNPNDPDSDHDGVNDGLEYNTYHTNPLTWDTDGDALPDAYEIAHWASAPALDPLNLLDGAGNFDADGNSNAHEFWNGSDPWTTNPVGGAGCFYWADAGAGDGIVSPTDAIELKKTISGGVGNYTGVVPNNGETHELDMDGYISPLDLIILQKMIQGSAIGPLGSRPNALQVLESPPPTVAVGMTCHVAVGVKNEGASWTPGFGVIYEIVQAQSTGTATILGGEGASGPRGRYDISGTIASSGRSRMVLRIDSAGTVKIRARVPPCGSPGVGRSSPEIVLDPAAVIVGQ